MKIEFEYPNKEFLDKKDLLIENLDLKKDSAESEIREKLNHLAKASFHEYIQMITDTGMSTVSSDIMQNRILLLIEHYFLDIPNESDISNLFQISSTRSRIILTKLTSSHKNKLKEKINEKIISFLNSNNPIGEIYEFEVKSKSIIRKLNEYIALHKPGLEMFKQKKNSAGKVTLHKDSFLYLSEKFIK